MISKLEQLKRASEEHKKFRETPPWIMFRKYILSLHNMTCDFCQTKYKQASRLDVHHKYDTNYTRLEESRFMVLCKQCHTFIHSKDKSPAFRHLVHRVDYVSVVQKPQERKDDTGED